MVALPVSSCVAKVCNATLTLLPCDMHDGIDQYWLFFTKTTDRIAIKANSISIITTHKTDIKLTAIVDKFMSKFGEVLPNDVIEIYYAGYSTCSYRCSSHATSPIPYLF